MKKKFLLLITLCAALSVQAQVTEVWKGGVMQACVQGADSIRLTDNVPSIEAAEAWAKENVDSLAGVVWRLMQASTSPNTRDPDFTREVFRSQGYDGRNVPTFLRGGAVVDRALLDSLIQRARAAGNYKVVMMAGNSGAGKSTAVKSFPEVASLISGAGIVLDETWGSRTKLVDMVKLLKEEGFDDLTLILVYNDAETSFNNACDRFLYTRRVIGLNFFLDWVYPAYQGYVTDFLEKDIKDMGVKRVYLDNAHNTPSLVTVDEASKWDYSLSDELKHKMAYKLYEYIDKHKSEISYRDAWAMFYDE